MGKGSVKLEERHPKDGRFRLNSTIVCFEGEGFGIWGLLRKNSIENKYYLEETVTNSAGKDWYELGLDFNVGDQFWMKDNRGMYLLEVINTVGILTIETKCLKFKKDEL